MTRRTYSYITNLCFAIAVAAVLLFDRAGSLNFLLGGLLVASGLLAGAVHLYSQWHPPRPHLPAATTEQGLTTTAESKGDIYGLPEVLADEVVSGLPRYELPFIVSFRRTLYVLSQPRQRLDTDLLIEVAKKLSPNRADYEVTLTPEGNLTIRPLPLSRYEPEFRSFEKSAETRNPQYSKFIH
jgi:hypothetical protein